MGRSAATAMASQSRRILGTPTPLTALSGDECRNNGRSATNQTSAAFMFDACRRRRRRLRRRRPNWSTGADRRTVAAHFSRPPAFASILHFLLFSFLFFFFSCVFSSFLRFLLIPICIENFNRPPIDGRRRRRRRRPGRVARDADDFVAEPFVNSDGRFVIGPAN